MKKLTPQNDNITSFSFLKILFLSDFQDLESIEGNLLTGKEIRPASHVTCYSLSAMHCMECRVFVKSYVNSFFALNFGKLIVSFGREYFMKSLFK